MNFYTQLAVLWLGISLLVLAILVWTVVSIYRHRDQVEFRRAGKIALAIAFAVGIGELVRWAVWGDAPLLPLAPIVIPLFYMAPSFIVVFVAHLAWTKRVRITRE